MRILTDELSYILKTKVKINHLCVKIKTCPTCEKSTTCDKYVSKYQMCYDFVTMWFLGLQLQNKQANKQTYKTWKHRFTFVL